MRHIDQFGQLRLDAAMRGAQVVCQGIQRRLVFSGSRIFDGLAPFHLLHQKRRRHLGVVGVERVDALQFQKIHAAVHRMPERLVRLVHLRRPLHCHPLFRFRLRGETIGMHRVLQLTVGRIELVPIQRVRLRQAEKFEVGLGEVHFRGQDSGIRIQGALCCAFFSTRGLRPHKSPDP